MKTAEELINLINLEQAGIHTFKGYSASVGSPNVFGGQVLAQAINAAYRTVPEERICHSFHGYFILPGDLTKPIFYKVQLIRDGGSFTTRYVIAEQDSVPIFVLASSFQKHEEGLNFQAEMPKGVPDPDDLISWNKMSKMAEGFIPKRMSNFLSMDRPLTIKPTVIQNPFGGEDLPPVQNVWFRFNDLRNNITPQQFQEMIAYASDYNILFTSLQPHASVVNLPDYQMASLDHAMWFHRTPDDYTDWFLYNLDAVSNQNARGLTTGKIFDRKGNLIATVSQEGLIRKLKK